MLRDVRPAKKRVRLKLRLRVRLSEDQRREPSVERGGCRTIELPADSHDVERVRSCVTRPRHAGR